LCLIGGRGTISTIDLPMRIVLRVERKSLGLDERDVMGDETMIDDCLGETFRGCSGLKHCVCVNSKEKG
jgi:hypothetical protein